METEKDQTLGAFPLAMKPPGESITPEIRAFDIRTRVLVGTQLLALAAMIGVTFPLWFPGCMEQNPDLLKFPAIPATVYLTNVGPLASWVISGFLLGVLICSLVINCVTRFAGILNCLLVLAAVLLMIEGLINQHRLLPWVLQSIILFLTFAFLKRGEWFRFCRALIVTIYIYSAISKLDFQFVRTTGREILGTIIATVGWDLGKISEATIDVLVLSFPVAEMAIGIGLVVPAFRLGAMCLGVGMHVVLILVLGPLGLQHAESVLIWNALFAFQLAILYFPSHGLVLSAKTEKLQNKGITSFRFAWMVILIAVFPGLEKLNCLDHWPAWALYSPRSSRCRLKVANWKVEQQTGELQKLFRSSNGELTGMQTFDFGAWSIQTLRVPVYPQDRFQAGLASYVVSELNLDRAWELEIQSVSNFWTGERRVEKVSSKSGLEQLSRRFWANVKVSSVD